MRPIGAQYCQTFRWKGSRETEENLWEFSGETGIRTRDTLLTYTRFPDVHAHAKSPLIVNRLRFVTVSLALILRFFSPNRLVKLSFSGQQPPCRYTVVDDEEGQPCRIEASVSPLDVMLQFVQVPPIYIMRMAEGLNASELPLSLQPVQGREEPSDYQFSLSITVHLRSVSRLFPIACLFVGLLYLSACPSLTTAPPRPRPNVLQNSHHDSPPSHDRMR